MKRITAIAFLLLTSLLLVTATTVHGGSAERGAIASRLFDIPFASVDHPTLGANYDYNPFGAPGTGPGYEGGHSGLDMQTKSVAGTSTADEPFYAVSSGTVISGAGGNWDSFNSIAVYDSSRGITVLYLHARRIDVSYGQSINVGDPLGIQGAKEVEPEEHVHLEVRNGLTPYPSNGAGATVPPLAIDPEPEILKYITAGEGQRVRVVSDITGVPVSGAACTFADIALMPSDNDGFLNIPAWLSGIERTLIVLRGHLRFNGLFSFPAPALASSSTSDFSLETPVADQAVQSGLIIPLTSALSAQTGPDSTRFVLGDLVEVSGTVIGLRARYPDPASDSWIVMPDGARGTVVGALPVWSNGYFRWQIRFDDLPTINFWCAEGEPNTAEYFLRNVNLPTVGTPTITPNGGGFGRVPPVVEIGGGV